MAVAASTVVEAAVTGNHASGKHQGLGSNPQPFLFANGPTLEW
jgi:hypothetical protein